MKRLLFSVLVLMGFTALQVSAEPKGVSMDADKDGKVSCEEFCAARGKMAEKKGQEFDKAAAEKQFVAKDKDGDGFLTGDELAKAPKKEKPADEGSDDE